MLLVEKIEIEYFYFEEEKRIHYKDLNQKILGEIDSDEKELDEFRDKLKNLHFINQDQNMDPLLGMAIGEMRRKVFGPEQYGHFEVWYNPEKYFWVTLRDIPHVLNSRYVNKEIGINELLREKYCKK